MLHARHESGCLNGNASPLSMAAIFTTGMLTSSQHSLPALFRSSSPKNDSFFAERFLVAADSPSAKQIIV